MRALKRFPTFLMGIFKLPDGLCEDLTKMIRNFWWGAAQGQRRRTKAKQGRSGRGAGLQDDGSSRERAWTAAEMSKSGRMTAMGFPVEIHEL